MKFVFFGLGSIGQRHARLLKERDGHELFAFRHARGGNANPLNIPEIYTWDEFQSVGAEAAFITNPTHLHIETALPLARRGVTLFMEKPVDVMTKNLDGLMDAVKEKNIPTYVAYHLRFHPAVRLLKESLEGKKIFHARVTCATYMPEWRKDRNPLEIYSAYRARGGGAILDVSHEFDLSQHLFGEISGISGRAGRVTDVTVDAEDYVDALLACEKCPVNLHINLFCRKRNRTIRVDAENGYFEADLEDGWLTFHSPSESWERKFDFELDDLYRAQLSYFLENASNPGMMNNLFEASGLFRKLLAFRDGGAAPA